MVINRLKTTMLALEWLVKFQTRELPLKLLIVSQKIFCKSKKKHLGSPQWIFSLFSSWNCVSNSSFKSRKNKDKQFGGLGLILVQLGPCIYGINMFYVNRNITKFDKIVLSRSLVNPILQYWWCPFYHKYKYFCQLKLEIACWVVP